MKPMLQKLFSQFSQEILRRTSSS